MLHKQTRFVTFDERKSYMVSSYLFMNHAVKYLIIAGLFSMFSCTSKDVVISITVSKATQGDPAFDKYNKRVKVNIYNGLDKAIVLAKNREGKLLITRSHQLESDGDYLIPYVQKRKWGGFGIINLDTLLPSEKRSLYLDYTTYDDPSSTPGFLASNEALTDTLMLYEIKYFILDEVTQFSELRASNHRNSKFYIVTNDYLDNLVITETQIDSIQYHDLNIGTARIKKTIKN